MSNSLKERDSHQIREEALKRLGYAPPSITATHDKKMNPARASIFLAMHAMNFFESKATPKEKKAYWDAFKEERRKFQNKLKPLQHRTYVILRKADRL